MTTRPSPPRILLVEADDDHRKLLVRALGRQGYAVDQATSAQEAQHRLASRPYGLVITHHGLPGKSGTDLLSEARAAGLLANTRAIVFTGRPDVDETAGFEVLRKPLDIGVLLRQVESIIGAAEGPGPTKAPPDAAGRVELVLYVTKPWPSSLRALRNVQQLLESIPEDHVALTVCDLAEEPERAERDRVIFSPTLVKVHPAPRMWVVGDLSERAVVLDLLATCGIEVPASPA
jgi:DNA-binding response OmpR family regulator